MFRYTMKNLGGTVLARTEATDAIAAIQWLFSNFASPPPAAAISLVRAGGNSLQYSVGPFDLIVEQGS